MGVRLKVLTIEEHRHMNRGDQLRRDTRDRELHDCASTLLASNQKCPPSPLETCPQPSSDPSKPSPGAATTPWSMKSAKCSKLTSPSAARCSTRSKPHTPAKPAAPPRAKLIT